MVAGLPHMCKTKERLLGTPQKEENALMGSPPALCSLP